MNWALVLAVTWLLSAVPVALLFGHAIRRSGDVYSTPAPTAGTSPPDAAGAHTPPIPQQALRVAEPQPARRPRAR